VDEFLCGIVVDVVDVDVVDEFLCGIVVDVVDVDVVDELTGATMTD
jgi:hypothetical protein